MTADTRCTRCGYKKSEHHFTNYAEGALVGLGALICPSATFSDDPAVLVPKLVSRHEALETLKAPLARSREIRAVSVSDHAAEAQAATTPGVQEDSPEGRTDRSGS